MNHKTLFSSYIKVAIEVMMETKARLIHSDKILMRENLKK